MHKKLVLSFSSKERNERCNSLIEDPELDQVGVVAMVVDFRGRAVVKMVQVVVASLAVTKDNSEVALAAVLNPLQRGAE